jgi:U4/U6 small nuclear ribonucleoprotein PRP4
MDGVNGKPAVGRIHFGSLEAVEARNRQAAAADSPSSAITSSQAQGVALDELRMAFS